MVIGGLPFELKQPTYKKWIFKIKPSTKGQDPSSKLQCC
jgi:hypothetical protein